MVGFGFASVTYPDKDENYWEEVLPTNAMVLNRTSFPNISETYSLSDWVPEVIISEIWYNFEFKSKINPFQLNIKYLVEIWNFLTELSLRFIRFLT